MKKRFVYICDKLKKNVVKHLFKYIIGITLISLGLFSCKSIIYGVEQGIGQAKLLIKAQPIEEMLQSTEFPDSLKPKLALVPEIKKYAEDSLGLVKSENYSKVYDQKGKPVLWVVIACPKYEMKAHQWKFPIVGKFSYLGFFKKEKAIKEQNKLKKKGFDTRIGTVSAWSTLGYFKDPILSNILFRSEGRIARLIFHELTHTTYYRKNDAQFSENLATFYGDIGAKKYLIEKYGVDSEEYKQFVGEICDIDLFSKHILRGAKKLDSLYKSFNSNLSDSIKNDKKQILITKIINDLDTVNFNNKKNIKIIGNKKFKPNNAFFVNYITYRNDLSEIEKLFNEKYNSDYKYFINEIKKEEE